MKELEGRTGIVTGGSSGIGYAIANTLAQAGAKVYAISRSGAVKSGMAPSAEGVIHVRGDVTDGARMAEIIREIGEKKGLIFWSTTRALPRSIAQRSFRWKLSSRF